MLVQAAQQHWLNSILYVPPTDEQLREVSSVAAEEEHERGDSSYHKYQLMSLIRKEYRASKVTLANGEIGPNPAHFDVYHLVTGFAGMIVIHPIIVTSTKTRSLQT